jgi:hypothetical protein
MPIGKHYGGHGEEVAANMKKEYGKNWQRVFYATENKMKSHMPKGATLTPRGNLGARRAAENASVGGFTVGSVLDAARAFTSRHKGSIT